MPCDAEPMPGTETVWVPHGFDGRRFGRRIGSDPSSISGTGFGPVWVGRRRVFHKTFDPTEAGATRGHPDDLGAGVMRSRDEEGDVGRRNWFCMGLPTPLGCALPR